MASPGHQGRRCGTGFAGRARSSKALSAAVAAAALLLLASVAPQVAGAPVPGASSSGGSPLPLGGTAFRPGPTALPAGLAGAPAQGAAPIYDEQIGATFTQSFGSLAYNVTALAQTDADGYGPGYLLNGLTLAGYWYQAGVSYHWPDSSGSYFPTFSFNYQVYGPQGKPVFPLNGGAGEAPFIGVVHSGDSVLLSLTFTSSTVLMLAQDWSTGATARASFSNEGASAFEGDASSGTNFNGFFTGLMTEWYHSAAYYGNQAQVTYTNDGVALASAWVWIDEFQSGASNPTIFLNQTASPVTFANEKQLYPFAAEGATAYISAHQFITGMLANASSSWVTLSPAASEASTPSISAAYTLAGLPQTAVLVPGTSLLQADPGSPITIRVGPSASGSPDRWVFNGTSGTEVAFAAGTNATYVYYHLVEETVSYQVAGGGEGPPSSSAPILSYEEAPPAASGMPSAAAAERTLGTTSVVIFALVGSDASIGTIPGASGERWAAASQSWVVSAPGVIPSPIELYQQYDVSIGYSIVGGGTPPETPNFDSTAVGGQAAIPLIDNATTGWFDVGSSYSFTGVLNGSTSSERWSWAGAANSSSITSPNERLVAVYNHQFYVTLGVNDASGGNLSTVDFPGAPIPIAGEVPSSWFVWINAGSILDATPSVNQGWQFESWSGSGPGAYSGTNLSIGLTVSGPLSENATFYVQLTIAADADTNIAYSYGSQSGTIQSGTTKTLYVPPSSNVTLRATPSLFVYSFASWKGEGVTKATKPSLALVVNSPNAVTGASSLALPVVLGLVVVAALVVILAASLLVRSRRRRAEIYGFSPSYP